VVVFLELALLECFHDSRHVHTQRCGNLPNEDEVSVRSGHVRDALGVGEVEEVAYGGGEGEEDNGGAYFCFEGVVAVHDEPEDA